MVDYVSYGGCKIYVRPSHALGRNLWRPGVTIQRWGEERLRHFDGKDGFETARDAILPSVDLGKRIIDGKVRGAALDD